MVRSATLSPRASSRSRRPPETIVSTTSLTVPPSAARTDLTSLRRTWRPAPRAMRPDRPGQRGAADRAHHARGRGHAAQQVPRLGERVARRPRRRANGAQLLGRVEGAVRERAQHELGAARLRLRLPRVGRRRWAVALEHDRHQIGGGDAVDHAVMDLREQRPAALAQSLEHPDLPERLVAVEVLGEDARGRPAELLVAARRRKGAVAQVVGEVEVGIVHPHRTAQAERYEANLLAIARDEAELARHHLLEPLERRRRPLEDAHAADVHRVHRALEVQERRVHRAHPVHRAPPGRGSRKHSVDLRVHRHAGVARLDLDVLRGRVEAGLPGDDPVASRVDRHRAHGDGRGASRSSRNAAQHGPSPHSRDSIPGTPRSPSRATERTAPSTAGATLSGLSTGEPSITSVLTRSGLRTAATRASSPPRLCPIRTTRPSAARRAAEGATRSDPGALGAIGVEQDAGSRGARAPPSQPSGEHAQRLVPRHEPGHEQHRGGVSWREDEGTRDRRAGAPSSRP